MRTVTTKVSEMAETRRGEAREDGHLEEQIGIQSDEAGNDDNVKTEQEHRQIL